MIVTENAVEYQTEPLSSLYPKAHSLDAGYDFLSRHDATHEILSFFGYQHHYIVYSFCLLALYQIYEVIGTFPDF